MKGSQLRKHTTSFVLVAAAIGLGAYVWLDRDRPTTDEFDAREGNLLPIVRREEITRIDLEHDGKKASIVRRDSGDAGEFMYHLVEQGKADEGAYADQVAVEHLIQGLELATRIRKLDGDFDRKAGGLEPPKMRLTVQMGETTYGIAIGGEAKTPAGARFAQLDGQGTYVIPRAPAENMIRPIDEYRTRRVIPYTSTELVSIVVEGPDGKVSFARAPWEGFRLDGIPGRPRVSKPVFNRMLGAFADATAQRFVDPKAAQDAIAKARDAVRLTFVPKEGPRSEVVVGGACPSNQPGDAGELQKLVAIARKTPTPLYACVPSTVLADLQVPAAAFVDRRVVAADPDEVEEIAVTVGKATLELARKGSGWHSRKPEDRQVPGEDVAGYLVSLLALEGSIVADPDAKELGLDPPKGTLTIRQPTLDEKSIPPQMIEIGNEVDRDEGKAIALRRKQDGIVLLVPVVAARLLKPSTTLIRSTVIQNVNPQHIQRVEVSHTNGRKQVLYRDGGGYAMETPAGFTVDAMLAADLFDAVSQLKAERWVADKDDGSFGLAAPSTRLVFRVADKEKVESRELLLGSATPDGRLARWEPDTGVFVLPLALDWKLDSYAIDRSQFMVDPNIVQGLVLRSGDREVRIAASGDIWRSASGSSVSLPSQSLTTIRQALIEMRAEGVVHLGGAMPEEGMKAPLLRIEVVPRADARRKKIVINIGRGDVWRTMNVYFVRREGTDATFAIAQSKVRPILELVAPSK